MASSIQLDNLKDIKAKFSQYTEHILDVNEFDQPKIYTGPFAIAQKISEIILMRPGTYPTRPYMGVGLIERYRYTFMDNINDLKTEVDDQIKTYLPEFGNVSVDFDTVAANDKVLLIYINIDSKVFSLSLDILIKSSLKSTISAVDL